MHCQRKQQNYIMTLFIVKFKKKPPNKQFSLREIAGEKKQNKPLSKKLYTIANEIACNVSKEFISSTISCH